MKRIILILLFCAMASCGPSDEETNIYRKENRFPGGLNVPVAPLIIEWAGKARVMGSDWLIDGGNGALFSAKHVTDSMFNDRIVLGGKECKVFLGGKVYNCLVAKTHALVDAVVLRITDPFIPSELPRPYKIAETPARVGDMVVVQGFHPHPEELRNANLTRGFTDPVVPIFGTFYGVRFGNECKANEMVFDNIEAKVVAVGVQEKVEGQEGDPLEELKYEVNKYFVLKTSRNHGISFAGLSGGVVARPDKDGELEALGIITGENPIELEYDPDGEIMSPCGAPFVVADTIYVTPLDLVREMVDYARYSR